MACFSKVFCFLWRYFISLWTLVDMVIMWHHHTVINAFQFLFNLALAASSWHDHVTLTYRYNLEVECNDGTIIEKKFLSLSQRHRMVGALVETGGWKAKE